MNYIYFFKIFYKFIKYFNKDINFLYYEMKHLNHYFLKIKDYNMTDLIEMQTDLIKQILKDENISDDFNDYLRNILIYFHF